MSDLLPFLKSMISTPGLSGYEEPIRRIIEDAWRPLANELSISRLGSLHALKNGDGIEPRPAILLAAHMDVIGLMVTGITGEFLRLTQVGGIDARVLPGQPVIVHGRRDLPGWIIQPPDRLLPGMYHANPVPLSHLYVDTGLNERQVTQTVRVGDLISFSQQPLELKGNTLAGHSLDNRASIISITQCLQELQDRRHGWDVWAVTTTQEEVTLAGAYSSAYQLRPQLAVVIDVSFAKSPGCPEHNTFDMGKGPTLGWGPNIHPGLHKSFRNIADKLEIPYCVEVMAGHSGTDAFAMQVTADGIPTMVIGIPLRYMHTPVEVVALKDLTRTGHLLAEFITQLDVDFMGKLSWDD